MKIKNYKFLAKPLFFVFNLLFATWLVFQVEKLSPSDFGEYKYLFEDSSPNSVRKHSAKQVLKNICKDYRAGLLDSTELEKKIDQLLHQKEEISADK